MSLDTSIPLPVVPEFIFVSTPLLHVYQRSKNRQVVLRDSSPNTSPSLLKTLSPTIIVSNDLFIVLRKDSHLCTTKYLIPKYVSLHRAASSSLHALVVSLSFISIFISNTYKQVMSSFGWKSAMNDVLFVLHQNQTWELTSLPDGKRTTGYR